MSDYRSTKKRTSKKSSSKKESAAARKLRLQAEVRALARKAPVRKKVAKKRTATSKKVAKKRATAPKKRATAPKKVAKKRAATPKKRAATPKKRAATPKKRAAAPKKRAATPKKRAAEPKRFSHTAAGHREANRIERNRRQREARAEAKRIEQERLAKLARAREKRAKAKAKALRDAKRVQAIHDRLRLEKEALRLKKGGEPKKETRKRIKKIREELKEAVAKPVTPQPEPTPVTPPAIVDAMTKMFWELYEVARKSDELPNIDYRQRIINSERSIGRKRMVKIGMLVTEDVIEEILHRLKKAVAQLGEYKMWMAGLIFSSMGSEIVGSGGRVLNANHPMAFKFQVESHDNTGVYNHPSAMLAKMEDILDLWASSEQRSLVYLHAVLVSNFNRRSAPGHEKRPGRSFK